MVGFERSARRMAAIAKQVAPPMLVGLVATMLLKSEAVARGRQCVAGYGRCRVLDPTHPMTPVLGALFFVALFSLFIGLIANAQIVPDEPPKRRGFSALKKGWRNPSTPAWAKYALVGSLASVLICGAAFFVLFDMFAARV